MSPSSRPHTTGNERAIPRSGKSNPRGANSRAQHLQCLIDALGRYYLRVFNGLFWFVKAWDEELPEPELRRFPDPVLPTLDGPDLAGQADLAEDKRLRGQRPAGERRMDGQQNGEIRGGLVDPHAPDGVDEDVIARGLHAVVTMQDREQEREPL